MSVFTEAEKAYLTSQRMARLATASPTGQPDVAVVTFAVEDDTIVSGGRTHEQSSSSMTSRRWIRGHLAA